MPRAAMDALDRNALFAACNLAAALVSVFLAAYAWSGSRREVARPFALLEFAIFLWCFWGFLGYRAESFSEHVVFLKLQYCGIVAVPVGGYLFARAMARRALGLSAVLAVALPALASLLVAASNEFHGLFWQRLALVPDGSLVASPGPWFWIHTAYSYALILGAFVALLRGAFLVRGAIRRWLLHTTALFFVPVAVNFVSVLFVLRENAYDPTPIAFAFSGFIMALGLRHYNVFDLVPFAKDAVFSSIRDPVLSVDAEGCIVGATAEAERIFRTAKGLAGRQLAELCAPAAAILPAGEVTEWAYGGRYYRVAAHDIRETGRRWYGSLVVFSDITEKIGALHTLAEREEVLRRYAFMVNASLESMSIINRDLVYEAVNDAFCLSNGRCREEIVGRRVVDVWGEENAQANILPALRACLAGERVVVRKRFAFLAETEERDLEVTYNPFRNAAGEVSHAVVITKDVSEYLATQRALAEARERADAANRAKSSFLAAMSHEIRTPLNAVIGLTELTLRGPLSAEQRDNLETVGIAGRTLLNVINDILDLSKIEAGRMSLERIDFDLPAQVAQVLKTFRPAFAAKGLSLALSVADECPRFVAGDPFRFGQVLMNLVGNAVKFTERGGVTVELLPEASPEAPPGRLGVRVSVRDSGIGIPEDKHGIIFESFAQADSSVSRRFGGTGLGLSICRNLVGLFGGRIWVESKPGEGSVFTFTAFFDRGDEARASARSNPAPLAGSGPLAILLVEDNPINVKVARRWLEAAGHRVTWVGSGAAAIEALADAPFDLVLMDVEMPEMDGLEATQRIRGGAAGLSRAATPVIAITAHSGAEARESCARAGMDDYVGKPLDFAELAAALARVARPASRELGAAAPASGAPNPTSASRAGVPILEDAEPMRRLGGDKDLLLELRAIFAAEAEGRRSALEAAATDRAEIRRIAHRLRGSAAAIGADALAAAAADLERAATAATGEPFSSGNSVVARLLDLLDATAAEVRARLPPGYEAPIEE